MGSLRARVGSPVWVHVLLFALSVLSTLMVGGLAFSATLMLILVAHEAGHYLTAKSYGVQRSLPYFIPLPFPQLSLLGTLGAVISMRTDQATRNELLDIGAAGPICGFMVAVPAMIVGAHLSVPAQVANGEVLHLGDSFLSYLIERVFAPEVPPGYELMAHPILMASWAGFLVTALNLLPMGQLDGGHVLFAWSPDRSERRMKNVFRAVLGLSALGFLVHLPGMVAAVGEGLGHSHLVPEIVLAAMRPLYPWFTMSFVLFAILARATGLKHPPARDQTVPLTPRRRATAWLCLVILILTFMPNPAWVGSD